MDGVQRQCGAEIMVNRLLFGVTFATVGALVYGWYHNRENIKELQTAQIQQFINAGPRFTSNDGRDLCEIVRVVALHSIGFQQSGLPLPDCEKYFKVTVPATTQLKIK